MLKQSVIEGYEMAAILLSLLIPLVGLTFAAGRGIDQKMPVPSALLGNLKIEISKIEQTTMVGDALKGLSTYRPTGAVYLKIKNIGDFSVCATILASVEEYKGSELQYTQWLSIGLPYNPQIQNLPPGTEVSGYYDFKPSAQKRNYVLVLEQRGVTQRCKPSSRVTEDSNTGTKSARLAFPSSPAQ